VFGPKNDIESSQKPDLLSTLPPDERLVVTKIKGERGIEYHLKITRTGKPFESWPNSRPYVSYVLVPNRERKRIRELRENLPVEYQTLTVIKSSPMNKFAADLVAAKGPAALDGIKCRRVNGRLRQMICKYCHILIMRGFVVNGHKVNRNKEFCSDACNKNFNYRSRRLSRS
jgi:hypothetical protein